MLNVGSTFAVVESIAFCIPTPVLCYPLNDADRSPTEHFITIVEDNCLPWRGNRQFCRVVIEQNRGLAAAIIAERDGRVGVGAAFERALASGKPSVLELPVDPERISPRVKLSELRGEA